MKTSSSIWFVMTMAVAACSGSPKTSSVQQGGGSGVENGGGGEDAAPAELTPESYGSACDDDGTCPGGLTCARYYGIAGPSGPEFSSCEMPCDGKEGCPEGLTCQTIADGPGRVCRP